MGWIQFLFHWKYKPRIPSHLVTPFDITTISNDDLLILKAGKARDLPYIERLMVKYNATSRVDLLRKIPKRRRTPVRQRVRTLICRWEGSLPYDPIRRELHYMRQKERGDTVHGIRRTRMPFDER